MPWPNLQQSPIRRALIAFALLLLAAGPATASDYCVSCEGPDTSYRCVTNDGREGAGKDQREALHCITEIARRQGHGRCSIDNTAGGTCMGQPIAVDVAGLGSLAKPGTSSAQPGSAAPNEPGPAQTAADPPSPEAPDEPPAMPPLEDDAAAEPAEPAQQPTLLEKSQQNIEKAGKAIGSAAKKSWTCMSSLFSDC